MLLSTIFNSLLEELKDYIKVIPLTEQMQHMPKHKKSPCYFQPTSLTCRIVSRQDEKINLFASPFIL